MADSSKHNKAKRNEISATGTSASTSISTLGTAVFFDTLNHLTV